MNNSKNFLIYLIFILSGLLLVIRTIEIFIVDRSFNVVEIKDTPEVLQRKILDNSGTYMVNFFASWCSSCLKEHHYLMALKEMNHMPIYGISVMDKENNVEQILNVRGNPFTKIYYNFKAHELKDIGIQTLPKTIIIKDNKVVLDLDEPITSKIMKDKIAPILKLIEIHKKHRKNDNNPTNIESKGNFKTEHLELKTNSDIESTNETKLNNDSI